MGEKDDSAWVFDSLLGFLQGPIWSAPLLTFIEEKSLIFDSETEDSEEYRHVYQEYKNLVDLLLGCYMEDIGITPEQFEHACSLNKNTMMPIQFQQSLFEQIWAANEYNIFKRMMTQKNLELQLQALKLIEQKFGLTPASLICENEDLHDELVMEGMLNEQYVLDDNVGVESELKPDETMYREHQRLAAQYKAEKQLLERALRESVNSSSSGSPEGEKRAIAEIVNVEPLQLTSKGTDAVKFGTLQPIPLKAKTAEVEDEENGITKVEVQSSRRQMSPKVSLARSGAQLHEVADEEEMKMRQTYLKTQRDKLVSLKKAAHSQRLKTNTARPGSARIVAEASMMGKQGLEVPQLLEPSKIQVRKVLAARLKAEVVHK